MIEIQHMELFPLGIMFFVGFIMMMQGKAFKGLLCILIFAGVMYLGLEMPPTQLFVFSLVALGAMVFAIRMTVAQPAMKQARKSGVLFFSFLAVLTFFIVVNWNV